jgi:hypothetical protein
MNNSHWDPLQTSHKLKTLCHLASLGMGGPLKEPIRCVDTQVERYFLEEPIRDM